MGEKQIFQPLSRKEVITVVLYRIGIVMSAIIISGLAYLLATESSISSTSRIGPSADLLVYCLYASVGISVFCIHLYMRKLKTYLKNLYFISLGCFVVILFCGKGSLSGALTQEPYSPLLLLPLSGCMGFVTAKEAFCFKLLEGYLLAMLMPIYLLLVSGFVLTGQSASSGLILIAAIMVLFTLRKVFMPIAYDVGDKSAYR